MTCMVSSRLLLSKFLLNRKSYEETIEKTEDKQQDLFDIESVVLTDCKI